MAYDSGGRANKLGNRYEGRWVAKQLLRLLKEVNRSVTIEAIGDDERGVDIWVELSDGKRQGHQCKARNASKEYWSVGDLNAKKIIDNIKFQLNRDSNSEFWLVTGVSNTVLGDICDSARNSNGNSEDFFKNQIETKGEESKKAFKEFCKDLSLDHETEQGRASAFDYLSRTYIVPYHDNPSSWQDLLTEASYLLTGSPETIISTLISYAENNDRLGNPIYADEIYAFLQKEGIERKNLARDTRILPVIQERQREFIESIQPNLIQRRIISRVETDKCMEALEENGLVILHGNAGSGKSGVLYELTCKFNDKGIVYLPLRVDRRIPKNTARQYGESMDLPDSPVFCLAAVAGSRPSVAIRWTSAHSSNALDVCKELVHQVLSFRRDNKDIRIVLSCRTFDLEHDPELRNWLKDSEPNNKNFWTKVQVGSFTDDTLRSTIGKSYEQITERQKVLLANPQTLYIWFELMKEEEELNFNSHVDLMRKFWEYKFSTIERSNGVNLTDVDNVLDKIVNWMEANGRISSPTRIVSGLSDKVLSALKSNGIIQEQGKTISFCHQSYLDFRIAERVVDEIERGRNILNWIGSKENQTLFRREQLRQALNMLSEDSPLRFLETIKTILFSENVRFHLKHLVLEVFGQISELKKEMLDFCLQYIEDSYWKSHILETVFLGHDVFVKMLIDKGIIQKWLESNNTELIEQALIQLRSINDKIPDEVTMILKPYADKDGDWANKVLGTIGWQISNDSEAMFELRLQLARKNVFANFIHMKDVCYKYPLRVIRLIEAVFSTWNINDESLETKPNYESRFGQWYGEYAKALENISLQYPLQTWDMLLPHVERLTTFKADDYGIRSKWEKELIEDGQTGIERRVVKLIIEAGKRLSSISPGSLINRVRTIENSTSPIIQEIIARVYAYLPTEYSDVGINWLLDDITKLLIGNRVGESKYQIAGDVIEALSPYCSEELFKSLEDTLIHYHEPDERETARFYLEMRRKGYYEHYWGKTQYLLLTRLCKKRIGKRTTDLISALKRRDEYNTKDSYSSGRFIGSKLDKSLSKISDEAWLRIIENKKVGLKHSWKRQQVDKDNIVGQFSRSLGEIAKYFPERFARLALRFPQNVHSYYVSAIIRALQVTKVDSNFSDDIKKSWEPASIGTILAVLDRFCDMNDREVAISFCWLVRERAEENWPDNVIEKLIELASSYPELGYGERSVNWDGSIDSVSIHDLLQNTINCVRGVAADAIGRLLWNHKELLDKVIPAIEALVNDPHPVIRMASIYALLPVLNIDRDKAVSWFCIASKDDLRIPASSYAVNFINYTIKSHLRCLEPIIKSMIYSENSEVSRMGSQMVTEYNLLYGFFNEELEACRNGTVYQKKGVAKIATQFIEKKEYAEKCRELLETFINDSDEEVRRELNSLFRYGVLTSKDNIPFIKKYIFSEAFEGESLLFYVLKEYKGSLIDFSDIILNICDALCTKHSDKTRDIQTRFMYSAKQASELLLRLYGEVKENDENISNRCLDAWDMLFENRIGYARDLTKKIDNA